MNDILRAEIITAATHMQYPNVVNITKAPEVPHYDATPNHKEKYLAIVLAEAAAKRERKAKKHEHK